MDPNLLRVSHYGVGYIQIGEQRLCSTFLLTANKIYPDPGIESVQALSPGTLPILTTQATEIFLIGTGDKQLRPPHAFIADMAAQRIGVEYMDTPAACRTFNILVAEQRRVVALLFL